MKRKVLLSLLVTLSIVFSMFGTVFAADVVTGVDKSGDETYKWSYNTTDKTLAISGYDSPVQRTKSYSDYSSSVKSVEIHELDKTPGCSFSGFRSGMNNVTSITVDGKCSRLNILDKCPNNETIKFSSNTSLWTYVDLTGTENSTLPNVVISNPAQGAEYRLCFRNYKGASSVTVPAAYGKGMQLTYSFTNSPLINSVSFENNTTYIPENAFSSCANLYSVTIPSTVTKIEYSAFRDCVGLRSITIPAAVKSIGFNAFKDSAIKDIYYGGTLYSWYGLVSELDDDGRLINNVLHLDYCVVHCSDGDILIHKEDIYGKTTYMQNYYGWIEEADGWHYYSSNGGCYYGSIFEIDGKTYGFDDDMVMVTGWHKFNDEWYFFDKSSGAMKTGWLNDGGKWYYLGSDGVMATGWIKDGGKWYYFDPDSGKMCTGWIKDGGNWYFLKSDGSMASYEYCDGYWLDKNGAWTYQYRASWRKNSTGWWYGDDSGWYAKSQTLKIDGKNYSFDANGYWIE